MPLEVKIPPMGESISSGVLAKWHVADGDAVRKDQPLFELETDKITSEGAAEGPGRISLLVQAGSEVRIGQVVATIEEEKKEEGERGKEKGLGKKEEGKGGAEAPAAEPNPTAAKQEPKVDTRKPEAPLRASPPPPPLAGPAPTAARPPALPPNAPRRDVSAPAASPAVRQTRRKLTPLRQRIAERLVASQHEAAMLTTFNEVDMSAVMALRAKYQDDFVGRYGIKLGLMSFFAKAVVRALKEVPSVNAQIDADTIVENHYYDLGIAVSTEKGLMVPVIRDCDQLGMADIEKRIAEAAKNAREGRITLADLEGGVFTITNGGIFGSMLSTPIINPPQSAILGLHAINDRPVAVNGQVVVRPMMYLALSYDHRIVDGREAVTFLVKVKQAVEDPTRLLLSV
jgi:2-oxoglutarate dehydrogenase E2 component (dihydrolipoamide succinyltransferase)